nr:DUF2971 domain-containing protein [Massilia aurea]
MIEFGEIYFGSSFDFNDPFDCKPAFELDCADDEFVQRNLEYVRVKKGAFAAAILEPQIRARIDTEDDPRHPKNRVRLQDNMGKILEGWGVFCASEEGNNILMWSHYGANFSGVCIEIDTKEFDYLEKVNYVPSRPKINALPFGESSSSAVDKALYTKYEQWGYEKEWRALDDIGCKPLSNTGITRVIFGQRCRCKIRERIIEFIKNSGKRIGTAEIRPDETTFRLNIVDL